MPDIISSIVFISGMEIYTIVTAAANSTALDAEFCPASLHRSEENFAIIAIPALFTMTAAAAGVMPESVVSSLVNEITCSMISAARAKTAQHAATVIIIAM